VVGHRRPSPRGVLRLDLPRRSTYLHLILGQTDTLTDTAFVFKVLGIV